MESKLRAAAVKDEVGALAYILESSFGTSISAVAGDVEKMIAGKDEKAILACLVASVNIRENISFLSFADFSANYPSLVITGRKEVRDNFNFSALRAAGHLIAGTVKLGITDKINDKAGNCVFGGTFPTSEAGKINKETFSGMSESDSTAAQTFRAKYATNAVLKATIEGIGAKATKFAASVKE
jgi:hypothetical protein